MKNALFAFSLLLISASASAALPPYYQRGTELVAIVQSPAVAQAAAGIPIQSVNFVARDIYEVTAGSCTIAVAIKSLPNPPGLAGPRKFKVAVSRTSGCRH
jgi:hypothetical protein